MKRILLAAALLFATILHADDVPHRYIVATRSAAPAAVRQILTDDLSPRTDRDIQAWDIVDAFAANLTDSEVTQLKASRHVAYIESLVQRHLLSTHSTGPSTHDAQTHTKGLC